MTVKVTPKECADLWAGRLANSVDRIAAGIEKVTEAPGKKAALAADKMRANILKALDEKRWQAEVSAVTLEEWKKKTLEKGVPRIRAGAEAAKPEVEDFYSKLFPHIEAQQAIIAKMPNVTLEDNIARMTTHCRGMAKFTYKGRAR